MQNKIYDCRICLHANHVKRTRCQCCGTIPAAYSGTGHELNENSVPVYAARGCSRVENRRGRKLYFRTVPADYYAN